MKYTIKIQHLLLFVFLSALCGGNTGLVSAKLTIYTGAEGGNGTINCYLNLPGSTKFFCRNQCKEEDILVKTDGVTANNGRYSVKYSDGSSGRGILSVTITNLIKSDSGPYRCGLGKSSTPDSYSDFEIRVSDDLLDKNAGFISTYVEGDTLRSPCFVEAKRSRFFFCKDECNKEEDVLIETDQKNSQRGRYGIEYIDGSVFGLYVTIQQVTKSDAGWYKCGYGRALSPDSSSMWFSVIVIDASTTSKPTQTVPSSSTSVPSTSTFSSVFIKTTDQRTATGKLERTSEGSILPLVVCVPLVGVSLMVVLLLLYKWKKRRNLDEITRRSTDGTKTEMSVTYEKAPLNRELSMFLKVQHPLKCPVRLLYV
ncbi:polymeric immunoglobulin receptor-like [Anabas testudineus]|uniref:polymeric immunoglobulin receptor-like n=1 Tax=Anabas testudineus TaxID=64144 RepID=UPI000E459722|nr:polymeric immunoglobulin receptor-like [Anabas testudineus]